MTSSSPVTSQVPIPNKNELKQQAREQSVTSSRRKVTFLKLSQDVAHYQDEADHNLGQLLNLRHVMNDRQRVEKKLMANDSKSVKRAQTLIQTIRHVSNPLKAEKEKSRKVIARMI